MLADRVGKIAPFRVMAVMERAKELQAQGRHILHMEVGEPDFPTIQPIIDAGIASLQKSQTGYTQALGIPPLRQAIADYYASDYGLKIDPKRIIVTPGASGALLLMSALLVNAGDTLLMADPSYPCNQQFLRVVEGAASFVTVGPEQGYQLSGALIEKHWLPNTVGVLVASPANPTGEVLSIGQLQDIARAVKKQGGVLIADEIYQGLVYGERCHSALEVDPDAFVINSFSKYFGMTGWRIGWMVAPESALEGLEKLAQNLFISSPVTAQYAALAAFAPASRALLDARRDEFAIRRDVLLAGLKALGFGIANEPQGAYYIYADIQPFIASGRWRDSEHFCFDILERFGVALTPGTDFSPAAGHHYVRFAYTLPEVDLRDALQRLNRAITE
jgi:aspartate/methionine/tyrosine aminotransferase